MLWWFIAGLWFFCLAFCTLRIWAVVHGRPRIPRGQNSLWILPPELPCAPWPCLVSHVTEFLLILVGHLLSFKNIPVCLDRYYGWGAVGKAHGLIHHCVTPVSHPCHPLKSALSCFQLLETVELHQGERVSVPWAVSFIYHIRHIIGNYCCNCYGKIPYQN